VIIDDAIMDEGKPSGDIHMGVGISHGYLSMGGPARVADDRHEFAGGRLA
jgi:hypothetical protein